ncbi:MAG: 16S rRNA (adenine(1518)-N(6)/adenine(1519)-N(6))-dimethyltransferase RsmA [Clostridia bacterium]|nr:16S rRNA (adenine(1518)-N(6)/adenine(1519)-N(6))-dimethyltransferase RsmA [Clostridia bacterium]MDH7573354.1 16S rRNA (adenine(1518)-N(6)/adenine(1519)-N(6))-dimethyltransferase RsmA [Clostridia bacterium]
MAAEILPPEVDLASPAVTRAVVRRFNLRPRPRRGQHFLVSRETVRRIVAAADLGPDDVVVEVGSGLGTLTRALAATAGRVVALEVDAGLLPVLGYTVGALANVRIVLADVRRTSLSGLAREEGATRFKVVANLPYYLTSAFLRQLLTREPGFTLAVLTVQREVAERLLAVPGSKAYGLLTVAVSYFAEVRRIAEVGREKFWPRPEVDSTVVRLVRRSQPPVEVGDEEFFFGLVRAGFGRRRKILLNALEAGLGLPKERVRAVLSEQGFSETCRAEELSLEDYAALSRAFIRYRKGG